MDEFIQSLGSVSAVIGAQWGDEGKGKVTDLLAEHFDVIARACGGANAGHTIVVNGQKHVFHLLPSGCLHDGKQIVLGAGMVIHLPTLLEEIALLQEAGIDVIDRLHISSSAHILFEYHKEIDGVIEAQRTQQKGEEIGTTKRGIGPAYMDKARRSGIRMESLQMDLRQDLTDRASWAKSAYGITVDIDRELSELSQAASVLSGCVTDTVIDLHNFLGQGMTVLIEGAQASLLDIDHGTYPYVTSSSTTAAGALQGLGLPPAVLDSCIGVAKAYCTRVGSGDFPTEADEAAAARLRDNGGEFGATTGRPRRCGWLDISDLNWAASINGFTHINLTKLDVLDSEEEIPVGKGPGVDGSVQYERLPGWQSSTVGMRDFDALPDNARAYIDFIEEMVGVPVSLIGTGQGREQMIVRS